MTVKEMKPVRCALTGFFFLAHNADYGKYGAIALMEHNHLPTLRR